MQDEARPATCFGCRFLRMKFWADGSETYGCEFLGGIVTGDEDRDPKSCEKYTTVPNHQPEQS